MGGKVGRGLLFVSSHHYLQPEAVVFTVNWLMDRGFSPSFYSTTHYANRSVCVCVCFMKRFFFRNFFIDSAVRVGFSLKHRASQ